MIKNGERTGGIDFLPRNTPNTQKFSGHGSVGCVEQEGTGDGEKLFKISHSALRILNPATRFLQEDAEATERFFFKFRTPYSAFQEGWHGGLVVFFRTTLWHTGST
jgi:hypothetical protein